MTHEVSNQAPPRVRLDEYAPNEPLRDAVRTYASTKVDATLHEIGTLVGSEPYQRWAEQANTCGPVLEAHDRVRHRIDEVRFHPACHQLMRTSIRFGTHSSPWRDGGGSWAVLDKSIG